MRQFRICYNSIKLFVYFIIIFCFFNSQKVTAQCTNPLGDSDSLTVLVGSATDLHAGDKVLKTKAIYSSGIWYDAVITILTEDVPTGECSIGPATPPDNRNLKLSNVQPDENPYITYNITFVQTGSATPATPNGIPVALPARITLPDIDGAGTTFTNRNYTDIGGYNNVLSPDSIHVGTKITNLGFFPGGWAATGFTTFRTPAAPAPSVPVADSTYHLILFKSSYSTGDFVFGVTRDASLNPGIPSAIAQRLFFHEFYSPCSMAMPVKLSYFKLTSNNCKANLSWHSETEINFKKYEIEYSNNGIDYIQAGIVNAIAGNSDYGFVHEPLPGKAYYRLKQVDKDGVYEYSNIIAGNFNCNILTVLLSPNPATDKVSIRFKGLLTEKAVLHIYNSAGQMVLQKQIAAATNITEINTSQFMQGAYNLRIVAGHKIIANHKFIVEK